MLSFGFKVQLPIGLQINSQIIRHVFLGIVFGISLSVVSTSLSLYYRSRKQAKVNSDTYSLRPIELRSDAIVDGVIGMIGNTPLVRIKSLSDALGVEILGKAEYLNPGGSVKDRVALRMIEDAERQGLIHPNTGSRIFEGTVGSTGISIATIAKARGYDTTIVMPDDVAQDKVNALHALGADVYRVRPASIVDKKQFVNLAKQMALDFGTTHHLHQKNDPEQTFIEPSSLIVTSMVASKNLRQSTALREMPRGFFADQFENKSNYESHFSGTGPEIFRQTNAKIDAFVSGAGTGGTIAGVGHYLKSVNKNIRIVLADPEGSGVYNKVKHGVMFSGKEREGTRRRHQIDTVVEGIGINRLTNNLALALPIIDEAFRIVDEEAVSMSRYLMQKDGLFLGSSSACNLVACIKTIKQMGWKDGQVIVTILCDSGSRHYSKFWNDVYLEEAGIRHDLLLIEKLLAL